MIAEIELYVTGLLIFAVPAIIISIPAYYILNKKNRIFIPDYFLPVYATTLLAILFQCATPLHYGGGVSNLLEGNILVAFTSIVINYGKIFIPSKVSTKTLSILAFLILTVITALLFFFIPSTGE